MVLSPLDLCGQLSNGAQLEAVPHDWAHFLQRLSSGKAPSAVLIHLAKVLGSVIRGACCVSHWISLAHIPNTIYAVPRDWDSTASQLLVEASVEPEYR